MKFLGKLLVNVPEQITSTFILFVIVFVAYRGIVSVWQNLPSPTTCLVVIGIGAALGIFASLPKTMQPNNEYD